MKYLEIIGIVESQKLSMSNFNLISRSCYTNVFPNFNVLSGVFIQRFHLTVNATITLYYATFVWKMQDAM